MRRSCRLSLKHEHRLLRQAAAEAADAAAAEAAEEAVLVIPPTVSKAIAGLATPSLPSPSMFPEDWRMVEELFEDSQGIEAQQQPLCPIKLFAEGEDGCHEARPCQGTESSLVLTGTDALSTTHAQPQEEPAQPIANELAAPSQAMLPPQEPPLTFSQLLSEAEAQAQANEQQQATRATPCRASVTAGETGAPPSQGSLAPAEPPGVLPELSSCQLDQVDLDLQGLDELMWEELDDLGMEASAHQHMASLAGLEGGQLPADLASTAFLPSAMPSHTALSRPHPPPGTFVPLSSSSPSVPAFLQLPHHTSIGSQQSSDSASSMLTSWHHYNNHNGVMNRGHYPGALPSALHQQQQQPGLAASRLYVPTCVPTATTQHQAPPPAKKSNRGRKPKAALLAAAASFGQAAAATASACQAIAGQSGPLAAAAPAHGNDSGSGNYAAAAAASASQGARSALGEAAAVVAGATAVAVKVPQVRKKRGPYKKRVKKEGEQKPAAVRRRKANTIMPAVEAFAKQLEQQPQGAGDARSQQPPAKRARLDMSLPSSWAASAGLAYSAAACSAGQPDCLPLGASYQAAAGQGQGVAEGAHPPPRLVGAPRQFLQAALQARQLGQGSIVSEVAFQPKTAGGTCHKRQPSPPSQPLRPPSSAAPPEPASCSQQEAPPPSGQLGLGSQISQPPRLAQAQAASQAGASAGGARAAPGQRSYGLRDPVVSRLLQEAASAHAACGRALSSSPCPLPHPAQPSNRCAGAVPDAALAELPIAAAAGGGVGACPPVLSDGAADAAPAAAHAGGLADTAAGRSGPEQGAAQSGPMQRPAWAHCSVPQASSSTAACSEGEQNAAFNAGGSVVPAVATAAQPPSTALEQPLHAVPGNSSQRMSVCEALHAGLEQLSKQPHASDAEAEAAPGINSQPALFPAPVRLRQPRQWSRRPLSTSSRAAAAAVSSNTSNSDAETSQAPQLPFQHFDVGMPAAPSSWGQRHSALPLCTGRHVVTSGQAAAVPATAKAEPNDTSQHMTAAGPPLGLAAVTWAPNVVIQHSTVGCMLDPVRLEKLRNFDAAARAAGISLSEDSEDFIDESESSGSEFSASEECSADSSDDAGLLYPAASAAAAVTEQEEGVDSQKPQAELPFQPVGMRTRNGGSSKSRPPREEKRKRGTKHITMDFLEEGGYFDAPIQAAAQQLQVGVTTLKKICRTAKITRWPFRKRTSIERLIERTQYFMADDDDLEQKLAELQPLLAERECLKACQDKDVDLPIKKFRQSMFKRVHKEGREKRKAAKAAKAEQSAAAMRSIRKGKCSLLASEQAAAGASEL